jgi:DNA-binding CsgD family transcriptional regulator
MRLTLSSLLLVKCRSEEARREAQAVLREADLPQELYVRAELAQLLALMADDDVSGARAWAEATLAGRDGVGDAALGGALTALAFTTWDQGRATDAVLQLRAAVHRSDRGTVEARRLHPRLRLGPMLTAIGEFEEAATVISECRGEIERLGDTAWTAAPTIGAARLSMATGRLEDARANAELGLANAEALETPVFVPGLLTVVASVALYERDLEGAARHIERYHAEVFAGGEAALGSVSSLWNEARLADAARDRQTALEFLARTCDDPRTLRRLLLEEAAAAGWLVRIAIAGGDPHRADIVARCAEQLARANSDLPSVAARALHARGLLDRDPAALAEAAAQHQHAWASASAAEDAGVLLAEERERKGAADQLEAAMRWYAQAGAEPDGARVRRRLDGLGAPRRRRGHSDGARWGWPSLTAAEQRVARLVADGLTNAEVGDHLFRSRHTVDYHLRSIYRKLGIGSRVALARIVLERTQVQDPRSRQADARWETVAAVLPG